jgi:hypothetical protein
VWWITNRREEVARLESALDESRHTAAGHPADPGPEA